MSRTPSCPELGSSVRASVALAAWFSVVLPASASGNPIARIARVFNDDLVAVEMRIHWLRARQASLSDVRMCPLEDGFGFLGGRPAPNAPAPWVMLDLGRQRPIDDVFLVPAQWLPGQPRCLFPQRFRLELACSADFSDARVLLDQSAQPFPDPGAMPVAVHGHSEPARFVRLTVLEGRDFGVADAFALSEMLVFSDQQPVSFGAAVICSWRNRMSDGWGPSYLTDSRMPLGLWEGGAWSPSTGFNLPLPDPAAPPVELVVDLGADYPVERVHLLPLETALTPGVGIMPACYELAITPQDDDQPVTISRSEAAARCREMAAQVLHVGGRRGRFVRLSLIRPWQSGDRVCHGLAEIEVYADGRNVAKGATVRAWQGDAGLTDGCGFLTDGFTSRRRSLPLQAWLFQVSERAWIERELGGLLPLRQRMSSESELNATWLAAMTLGLGFLIPVAIVERRRLISREQVDLLRKRIASDLHDDIGSNLGSISMIARVVRRNLARSKGAEQAIEDLAEVEAIARESSQAMRDIVWLIERKHDTIGDLVKRLRETASRLLRDHQYTIDCDCRSDTSRLCLDAKRHLFLFCKEVMHNVVKHAQARHFTLRIEEDGGWLCVRASDDGVGLRSHDSGCLATVQKLRDRANVLAGVFDIDSADGRGTTVVLRIPRSVLQSRIPI
jgi:signal transduction histidine kinase